MSLIVVIHLEDFHFLKENFFIIDIIIQASRFKDLAFQAGVCTSGGIKSVLSGSHYNRAWTVQSIFLEPLGRLLFKNFLKDSIKRAAMIDPKEFNSSDSESAQSLLLTYVHFKEDIRQGKYGLTQKF